MGFAWQPGAGDLYAGSNGPDHWGFDLPPENFRRLPPGSFHGMPWCQWDGKGLFAGTPASTARRRGPSRTSSPPRNFPSPQCSYAVASVPEGALVPSLAGDDVVSLHGSWGTRATGGFFGDPATRRPPALVAVRYENGVTRRADDLVTGFQQPTGRRWARPVGVAIGPDGALYFSSDEGAETLIRLRRKAD